MGTGKWWPEAITQGFEFDTGYSLADHAHYCKRDPQPWAGDIVIKAPPGTSAFAVAHRGPARTHTVALSLSRFHTLQVRMDGV